MFVSLRTLLGLGRVTDGAIDPVGSKSHKPVSCTSGLRAGCIDLASRPKLEPGHRIWERLGQFLEDAADG